jgi:CcmD family protein
MMTLTRFVRMLGMVVLLAIAAAPPLAAQSQKPPAGQEGFVPIDQLEDVKEELPAAPLVAAAYGIAWAAVLVYVLSLWRRLGKVERELAEVSRRLPSGHRP